MLCLNIRVFPPINLVKAQTVSRICTSVSKFLGYFPDSMFSKSIKLKSDTMTKLGERKKLKKQSVVEWVTFSSRGTLSNECIDRLFPLKDPMFTKKFQGAERQMLTAYISSSNPIAFEFGSHLVPSLQTCWALGLDKPVFVVGAPVIEILSRGAALMAPGVLNWDLIENFERGDIYFICAHTSIVPVAICSLLMNFEEAKSCGFKGKLANILHIVGDELFKLGKLTVPSEEELLASKTANELNILEENGESVADKVENEDEYANYSKDIVSNEEAGVDGIESRSKSMEEILELCLLSAVKLCKNNFPILCSTFQSQYMIPSCPDDLNMDVKKSCFKKMSVFYKEYESKGLIKLSVSDKDVWSITSADLSHELLRGFKPLKDVSQITADSSNDCSEDANENFLESFVFPEISSVLLVSKSFSSVFKDFEKGQALTSNEVRSLVKEYVLKNCESDAKGVLLDPHLASLLLKKNENLTHLSWQELNQRSIDSLQPAYQIQGGSFIKPSLIKGQSHPILKVTTQKRAGNKHVTLIQNLDKFGINMKLFARFLQNLAASSSSINEDKASKFEYVQVQGNQIKLLRKLFFDQMKFPPKYVDIPIK